MLLHYHVKNFALIEDAAVDFGPGLNVLTGETGAGKSIMIDALNAALGARTGGDMIRRGAQEALVELVFSIEDPAMAKALEEMDINCEEGTLLISRRISPSRSLYRINGEAATSAMVKQLTEWLVDIHGQHEHQSLLKPERQLSVLDEFAGDICLKAREETAAAYSAYQATLKAGEAFSVSGEDRQRRLDFLEYEMQEIEQASVKPGEKLALEARFKEMSAFEKIEGGLKKALEYLSEGRENASEFLLRAQRELGVLTRLAEPLEGIHQELLTAQDILSSAEHEIKAYLEASEFDELSFSQTEKRLDELHRLELKYGDLSDPSNNSLEIRQKEWEDLKDYENRKLQAEKKIRQSRMDLEIAADRLHALRLSAAPAWDEALIRQLQELHFLSLQVKTELESLSEPGPGGRDRAVFTLSLNPGEDRKPLQKVASGGELSRIMLAIKTILAEKDRIPTVIFDEIDSGISGQTAQAVGRKLKDISRYRQVILITHLPQIAAPADRHYGIEKQVEGERTLTRIRLLNEEESLGELARLLGGDLRSESVYETARELKQAGR